MKKTPTLLAGLLLALGLASADSAAAAEQARAVHLGAFSSAQVFLSVHPEARHARLPPHLATQASL